jgi:hypothetical protein
VNFDDAPAEAAFRAEAGAWLQANGPRELLPTLEKVAYGDAILETPAMITAARTLSALFKGERPGPENSIGKLVAGTTMQEIAMYALDLQGRQACWTARKPPMRPDFRRC